MSDTVLNTEITKITKTQFSPLKKDQSGGVSRSTDKHTFTG